MKTENSARTALLLVAACLAVTAEAADVDLSRPVVQVPHRSPQPLGSVAQGQSMDFTTWRSAVEFNDVVGRIEYGLFCGGGKPFVYSKKTDDWFMGALAKKYRETATRLGVATAEASKSVFEEKEQGGTYRLGATLLEWDYRVCVADEDVKGDTYSKVKWEVFSSRRQKVVYTTTIEASHSASSRVPGKKFDQDFLQAIVDNLFADPKLVEVIKLGSTFDEAPQAAFAPLELNFDHPVVGGVSKSASGLLAAVATIESGTGSGSAFYVSREGYLLTNKHVVGSAAFVRVRLADGRNMVGEVLRTDSQRDVALLRTDPVNFDVLALRRQEARVGEEVFALGSPFGKVLSGTLTRGVLSANRVVEGVPFLQSDVAINPGNSGGPLIDGDGRVLGIAQMGLNAQGIGLFIPIEEAVNRLGLTGPGWGKPAVAAR